MVPGRAGQDPGARHAADCRPGLGARATAGVVALAGFCGAFLLPFFKYPANPPAVGNPDTIGHRTTLYLMMILISLVVVIGVIVLARQLQPWLGTWDGTAVAVAFGRPGSPSLTAAPLEGTPSITPGARSA